jgi:RsiW-degrading membrane proteinase PrsW (M82 family)
MTTGFSPVDTAPPQTGRLRRWSWVGVLVLGALAYLLVLRTLVVTNNPNFIPSLILLGSIVVPAAVLVFAASGGRQIVAPTGLVVFTAIAGGVIGTAAAGTIEYDTLHRLGALPMILVGLIEESVKLIVPVILLIFLRRSDPRAGVIIGVASGMGFATLETMGYGFTALLEQKSLAAVDQTLLLRALLSPAGHVAWTGLTVAALWRIPSATRRGRAIGRAIVMFVAAVLLHAAWDGFNSLIVHVVVGGLSVAALLMTIRQSHDPGRRRRRMD